jgi:hypothetical protein
MLKSAISALFTLFLLTSTFGCATDPGTTGDDTVGDDGGTGPGPLPPDGEVYYNSYADFAITVPQGYTHADVDCPDCQYLLEVNGDTMDGTFSMKYEPRTLVVDCDMTYSLSLGETTADCGADLYHLPCTPIVAVQDRAGNDNDPNVYTACGELYRGSDRNYHFSITLDDPSQADRFTQLLSKVVLTDN